MDQMPLVSDETKAGEEFVRRLDEHFPVLAAFWLKDSEGGPWYLHIASERIDDGRIREAYGTVMQVAREIANPYLDPFRVKLIPAADPLAQAALDIHRRYPMRMATRLGVASFGGIGVDGVFLYPGITPAPAP